MLAQRPKREGWSFLLGEARLVHEHSFNEANPAQCSTCYPETLDASWRVSKQGIKVSAVKNVRVGHIYRISYPLS